MYFFRTVEFQTYFPTLQPNCFSKTKQNQKSHRFTGHNGATALKSISRASNRRIRRKVSQPTKRLAPAVNLSPSSILHTIDFFFTPRMLADNYDFACRVITAPKKLSPHDCQSFESRAPSHQRSSEAFVFLMPCYFRHF